MIALGISIVGLVLHLACQAEPSSKTKSVISAIGFAMFQIGLFVYLLRVNSDKLTAFLW